jgi:hypothetical protein
VLWVGATETLVVVESVLTMSGAVPVEAAKSRVPA